MANGTFGGGDGTVGSPYLVEDAADLNAVRNGLSLHYRQVGVINLSTHSPFSRIGTSTGSFTGSYDGDNYEITNLNTLNGMFYSGNNSVLRNIKIVDGRSISATSTACLLSANYSTAYNCHGSGIVTGTSSVGGLFSEAVLAHDCSFTGSVTATSAGHSLSGGLSAGQSGTFIRCSFVGDVKGEGSYIGGIIGGSQYGSATLLDCFTKGTVTGVEYVGGIIGQTSQSVKNCYSESVLSGMNFAGGIAGSATAGCINCFYLSKTMKRHPYWNSSNNEMRDICHFGPATNCYSLEGIEVVV